MLQEEKDNARSCGMVELTWLPQLLNDNKQLFERSSIYKFLSFESMNDWMLPLKLFDDKPREARFTSSKKELEIGPFISFFDKSTDWTRVNV